MSRLGIISLIIYICSWVIAIIMAIQGNNTFAKALIESLFLFSFGVMGLLKCIGHLFFSERIARYTEWTHTPFQHEVGVAHLSFAILAILSFFSSVFWYASVVGIVIFYLGNVLIHIREMQKHGNFSIGNAGLNFYMDLIAPFTLVIGFLFQTF